MKLLDWLCKRKQRNAEFVYPKDGRNGVWLEPVGSHATDPFGAQDSSAIVPANQAAIMIIDLRPRPVRMETSGVPGHRMLYPEHLDVSEEQKG